MDHVGLVMSRFLLHVILAGIAASGGHGSSEFRPRPALSLVSNRSDQDEGRRRSVGGQPVYVHVSPSNRARELFMSNRRHSTEPPQSTATIFCEERRRPAMEFGSMDEFWGFYLSQHSKPGTRRWHFLGTLAALACALFAAATGRAALLLAAPALGYGMAWYSHFFVEGNRPATFGHPVWSFLCDIRMFLFTLTGLIDAELARFRVRPPPDAAAAHQD